MAWRIRNEWSQDAEARFFDLIAEGSRISDAAAAVGKSRGAGAGKFDRVRRQYGWQGQ